MSHWNYILGIIEVGISDGYTNLSYYKANKIHNKVKALFNKDIPYGSEGPVHITTSLFRNNRWKQYFIHIGMVGHLRDSEKEDEILIIKWVKNIVKNIESMEIKTNQSCIHFSSFDYNIKVNNKKV